MAGELPTGSTGRLGSLNEKMELFASDKAIAADSVSKAYRVVVLYLVARDRELVLRLFEEPRHYKGIYGVWLFYQGAWKCVVVDDRYHEDFFVTSDPFYLWNVLLQKAIIKTIGYKRFEEASVHALFEIITGSSSFETCAEAAVGAQAVRNSIEKGRILSFARGGREYIGERSLSERSQLLEAPSRTLLNVRDPLQPADSTFFKLEAPGLTGLTMRHINLYPSRYFTW